MRGSACVRSEQIGAARPTQGGDGAKTLLPLRHGAERKEGQDPRPAGLRPSAPARHAQRRGGRGRGQGGAKVSAERTPPPMSARGYRLCGTAGVLVSVSIPTPHFVLGTDFRMAFG